MENRDEISKRKEEIARWYNSEAYNKINNKFQQTDFFKILAVSRKEDRHSKFIAWLLDPAGSHELGYFPIKRFFRLVAISKNKYTNIASEFPSEYENMFIFGNYKIDSNVTCIINTEYTIPARNKEKAKKREAKDRLDIYIKNIYIFDNERRTEFSIVIENKINSSDRDGQTQYYYDWVHGNVECKECDRPPKGIPLCVFLYPEALATKCDCDKFIKITYQELVDLVIEPCLQKATSDLTKFYISEYLKTLSYSAEDSEGEIVMAYSKEERKLCEEFFNENRDLLTYVIGVLESSDDDDLNYISDYVNKTKTRTRDYTKYSFNGEGKYGKRRIALKIFQAASITHNTIDDIRRVFSAIFATWPKVLINDLDSVSDPDRYFHNIDQIIDLKDGKYYLAVDWEKSANGDGEFERLLRIARDDLGFEILESPS